MNDNTMKTKTCKCGTDFEIEAMEPIPGVDMSVFERSLCDQCQAESDAEIERQQTERAKRIEDQCIALLLDRIVSATPPIFRITDVKHPKFNVGAWEKVMQWKPTREIPWLGLSGKTGGCKTRIAFLAAKSVLEEIARKRIEHELSMDFMPALPTFMFVTSYEITEKVMEMFSGFDNDRDNAKNWLRELRKVTVLLIDDLGKGKLTPAAAAEMFALIDHRHTRQMVTIWTSNSTPREIAACMTDDMGPAFAGRINESSKVFIFK